MKSMTLWLMLQVLVISIHAQEPEPPITDHDAAFGAGSIALRDGTEIKGMLSFNKVTGNLSFESDGETRTFVPDGVTGFEYFDEASDKQRVFYSLVYQDPEEKVNPAYFYEVVKQFKDFVLLTHTGQLKVKLKGTASYSRSATGGINPHPTFKANNLTATQVETLYLMDTKNELFPYLEIIHKEVDKKLYDRSVLKTRIVDKDLMKRLLGDKEIIVRQHAKEMKWDFDEKDGLLEILDYYESLN